MHAAVSDVNRRATLRNVAMFTAVVWSVGWIAAALIAAALQSRIVDPSAQQLGLLLWLVTPLATVLLLRGFAGDGWKDFGLAPAFRANGLGWSAAVLVHPLCAALVVALGALLGWTALAGSVADLGWVFAYGLAPSFVKNVFEEFAWRGYLTPKVHALVVNDFVGHAVVGLIWAGWHVPYFLYLVDPAALHAATNLPLAAFVAMAVPSLIAVSIVYGELRLLTKSVWPAVVAHAIGNALIDVLIVNGFVQMEAGRELLASPGYQGVLSIAAFVVAGVTLHRLRMRREVR
jgi:membrane protease YdiL (CAAX protease family)